MIYPKITKAFILAAGFGTRLKPYTDNLPKALVEYKGEPMIENVISRLSDYGINDIVINTHHHADKMEKYFANWTGKQKITLVLEKEILGTGGAVKNVEKYFNDVEDFIIYNTDVDCNADIYAMTDFHFKNNSSVTLAVKNRKTSRFILTNEIDRVIGITQSGVDKIYAPKGVLAKHPLDRTEHPKGLPADLEESSSVNIFRKTFCGIHILKTNIVKFFPEVSNYDIIPVYMDLIIQEYGVYGHDIGESYWKDLGIPENL